MANAPNAGLPAAGECPRRSPRFDRQPNPARDSIKCIRMRALSLVFFAALLAFSTLLCANSSTYYGHPRRTGFPDQCNESLECTIAQCANVVRATLQLDSSKVLMGRVTETIKGNLQVGRTINMAAEESYYSPGDDVLLFFRGEPQPQLWRCYALDGNSVVMLMDLQKLTKTEDILVAARTIAANPPHPVKIVSLWSNGRILSVPQCERLEQLGRQWAQEKTLFKRTVAIHALRPFPSLENRSLIRPFLDDTRSEKPIGALSKWQVGKYTVRDEAAQLLQDWGEKPPVLPMSGPLLNYRPVNVSGAGYGLALAPALILLMACILLRRNAMMRMLLTTSVLVLIVLAIALVWWRSQKQVDEVMFGAGSSHHEISSYSGGIQYQVLRDWDDQRQLVFGSFDRELNDDVWSIAAHDAKSRRSLMGFVHASDTTFGPGGSTHRFGIFRIPYWMPLALILIPLAINLRTLARQIRRRRLGLCRHCGYDLRESPSGICPECGNQVPPKIPAASDLLLQTRNEIPIGGHPIGM